MKKSKFNIVIILLGLFFAIISFIFMFVRQTGGYYSIVSTAFEQRYPGLIVIFILMIIFLIISAAVTFSSIIYTPTKFNIFAGCFGVTLFLTFLIVYATNMDSPLFSGGMNEVTAKFLIYLGISSVLYIASGIFKE